MTLVNSKSLVTVDEVFQKIASGNTQAYLLCQCTWNWIQVMDDLVDGGAVNSETVGEAFHGFISQLVFNDFFLSRKCEFTCLFRQALNAWLDSERVSIDALADPEDKFAAGIIKSQYQDIFFEAAYWVGGYKHMREISRLWRSYYPDVRLPKG